MYLIWRRDTTDKGTKKSTLPNVIHFHSIYLTEDVLFVSSFSPLNVNTGDTSAPNLVKVNSVVQVVALPASNRLSGSFSKMVVPALEFLWVFRDLFGSWLITSHAKSSTLTSSSCSILSCSDLAINVDCVFDSNKTGEDTELWTPISGLRGLQFDVGLSTAEDSTPLVKRLCNTEVLSWEESSLDATQL